MATLLRSCYLQSHTRIRRKGRMDFLAVRENLNMSLGLYPAFVVTQTGSRLLSLVAGGGMILNTLVLTLHTHTHTYTHLVQSATVAGEMSSGVLTVTASRQLVRAAVLPFHTSLSWLRCDLHPRQGWQ